MNFVAGIPTAPTYSDVWQIDAGVCLLAPNGQVRLHEKHVLPPFSHGSCYNFCLNPPPTSHARSALALASVHPSSAPWRAPAAWLSAATPSAAHAHSLLRTALFRTASSARKCSAPHAGMEKTVASVTAFKVASATLRCTSNAARAATATNARQDTQAPPACPSRLHRPKRPQWMVELLQQASYLGS
jgi:hypothetical protein